jgi:hypothetical protein
MERIEEEDWNIRALLQQHVREDDALRLEARCDAGLRRTRESGRNHSGRLVDKPLILVTCHW